MEAVCPYYHRLQPNCIYCKGVGSGNTINIVFDDAFGNIRYKAAYCSNEENYKKCRICRMLDKKREEET